MEHKVTAKRGHETVVFLIHTATTINEAFRIARESSSEIFGVSEYAHIELKVEEQWER